MDLLIFYSRFSLISLSSFPSATQYSPILFLFPSSLLIYSLPIREYEPPPISSLPSLISFTEFFFFPLLFTLSSLFYLRVAYQHGSLGCGSLFYLESPIHCSLFLESPIRCSISEGFIDSLFLWRFHQFILHLLHTGKFSVFSVILWDCHIVI